jgi:hypothetical protein
MKPSPPLRTLDVQAGPWWWAELCPTCADHFARYYDEAESEPENDEEDPEPDEEACPF